MELVEAVTTAVEHRAAAKTENDSMPKKKSSAKPKAIEAIKGWETTVVFPDTHFQKYGRDRHDPAAISVALQIVADLNNGKGPDRFVQLGDLMNLECVSPHNKDLRRGAIIDAKGELLDGKLEEDYAITNSFLDLVEKATPNAKERVILEGNHDYWMWWYRNFQVNGPMKNSPWLCLPKALRLKERGFKWVPYGTQKSFYRIGKLDIIHGDYVSPYHAAKTISARGRNTMYGHCFDTTTELLTQRGFLKYDQLTEDDYAMTMNKATGKLEWNQINKIHVLDHKGEMISIQSTGVDLMIDDGHGLIGKIEKEGVFKELTAKELEDKPGDFLFKVSGELEANKEYPITDDMLKLLAWVYSDGSLRWIKNTPYVDIAQSKLVGIEAITLLLDKLDMSYLFNKKDGTVISKLQPYRFRLHADSSRRLARYIGKDKKKLPEWFWLLSNRQFEVFLAAYIQGDGTTYKGPWEPTRLLYCNDPKWVEAFQIRCFTSGYKTRVYWRKGSLGPKLYAQMSIMKKEFHEIKTSRNIKRVKYNGKKWCVSVDNGTLVVRRGDKITITQNCHEVQVHSLTNMNGMCRAWSIGCLRTLEAPFMRGRANSWSHAFAIVQTRPNGNFNVYVIDIINGEAEWGGKLYKAKPIPELA